MNTCSRCPATWGGRRMAHCGACHCTFASVALFDLHRVSEGEHGRCLHPAYVEDRDGKPRMRLLGSVWHGPEMPAEVLAKLTRRTA